jgi:hypothetical protein
MESYQPVKILRDKKKGKTEILGENTAPWPFYPPHAPQEIA